MYLCPECNRPLQFVRDNTSSFFSEKVYNCPACARNYYLRGGRTWIGSKRPVYAEDA